MRKKVLFCFLLSILTISTAFAESSLRTTVLPNGMRVIVKEDHSVPVVSMMVWVGVGSRNETDSNRGISHFIEHLLFKGTKTRAVGDISREIDSLGGRMNAATSYDYTQFYIEIGSRYMNQALDIFSDVIQNSAFDPAEVERERMVVQEEIRMDQDQPGKRLWHASAKALFTGHPYSYPVTGTLKQVGSIKREQILNYYHRYYVPNNMVLVIVGDVHAEDAFKKVKLTFKDFKKRDVPSESVKVIAPLKGIREIPQKMDLNQSYLMMGFLAPTTKSTDSYALDVLSQILGDGRSSRLYRTLREKQLVQDIDFGYMSLKDAGLLYANASLEPVKLNEVKIALLNQIDKIKKQGVTQEELNRAKTQAVSDWAFSHETCEQQSEEIGYYSIIGQPDYPKNYMKNIRLVNAQDVQRVARKYLTPNSYSLAVISPQKSTAPSVTKPIQRKTITADFLKLDNGMRVVTKESHNSDVVSLQLYVNKGSRDETESDNGIYNLMQSLILKGTKTQSADQIARLLESSGIQYSTDSGQDYSEIRMTCTSSGVETALKTLMDLAQNASFPGEEITKEKGHALNAIQQQDDDPDSYLFKIFEESFYQKYPYQLNSLGTSESIRAITNSDLLSCYQKAYRPQNMVLIVTGNIDKSSVQKQIQDLFGGISTSNTETAVYPVEPIREKPLVVEKNKDVAQTVMALGFTAPSIGDEDYPALKILATALGGNMGSILFDRIREKQGLVYTVSCMFPGKCGPSYLLVYAGTKPESAVKTKDEIISILNEIGEKGLTESQFESAKRYYLGNFDLNHQTAEDRGSFLGIYETSGVGYQYDQELPKLIEKTTLQQVNQAARKYLTNPGYVLAMVKPNSLKVESRP